MYEDNTEQSGALRLNVPGGGAETEAQITIEVPTPPVKLELWLCDVVRRDGLNFGGRVVRPATVADLVTAMGQSQDLRQAVLQAAFELLPCAVSSFVERRERDERDEEVAEEAVMVQIEALFRNGTRAAARQVAERFFSGYPGGQYAKRIEALVGPIGSQTPAAGSR